jgi:hypothetical protein
LAFNFWFFAGNLPMFSPFSRLPFPQIRPHHWQTLGVGLILIGWLCPFSVAAQEAQRATIRELLGQKRVTIQGRPAQLNAISTQGQMVATNASSKAGLLFGVQAGVRLGQSSSLTVGECVQLIKGQAIIAKKKDFVLKGCVGNILKVNPKGTVYIMKLDDQNQAQVIVLEGEVEVFSTQDPDRKVTVSAGQGITTTAEGTLTSTATGSVAVTTFSTAQIQDIAAPLVQDFQVALPGLDLVAFLPQSPDFVATFLREALLGREADFDFDGQQQQGEGAREPSSFSISNVVTGTFVRDTETTGRFISDAPMTIIPFSIDFDAQTLSIVGIPGISSSAGLNGNNASGTVVLPNTEVVRLEVFGVNKKEPPLGVPFRSTLGSGTARDR